MTKRLAWFLIMAFAIVQFGMASAAFASVTPIAAHHKCNEAAGNCCDATMINHCAACAACVAYVALATDLPFGMVAQAHQALIETTLSSANRAIDPPPPRQLT